MKPALRSPAAIRTLRRRLLQWYDRNRRALPWRADRSPYKVWLSEIMLQQTRVATALPFYERFLRRFPDVRSLASSSEEEVGGDVRPQEQARRQLEPDENEDEALEEECHHLPHRLILETELGAAGIRQLTREIHPSGELRNRVRRLGKQGARDFMAGQSLCRTEL